MAGALLKRHAGPVHADPRRREPRRGALGRRAVPRGAQLPRRLRPRTACSTSARCWRTASGSTTPTARVLADSGAQIAHSPSSNLFLGSGLFDWRAMADAGAAVSLASDVGGGTSLSMLRTMADAYKVQALRGERLTAWKALHAATRGAAQALGSTHEIGSLEAGPRGRRRRCGTGRSAPVAAAARRAGTRSARAAVRLDDAGRRTQPGRHAGGRAHPIQAPQRRFRCIGDGTTARRDALARSERDMTQHAATRADRHQQAVPRRQGQRQRQPARSRRARSTPCSARTAPASRR